MTSCSSLLLALSRLFPNMQKVVLSNLNPDELNVYSKELSYLSQLKHLIVHFNGMSKDQQIQARVFNGLFLSNTVLQSFKCENDDLVEYRNMSDDEGKKYFAPSSYRLETAERNRVLSVLTDITIQIRSLEDLIWLFTNAPNVKTLKVKVYNYHIDDDTQNIKQQLQTFKQPKNLEEFHLTGLS
jgi:hypothetical protein